MASSEFREGDRMAESGLLFRSLSDIAAQIHRQEVSPVEVTRVVRDDSNT